MNGPVRYLEGDRSRLGARLLRSAQNDGPDARSVQRALATAAVIASTAATTGTATATATLGAGSAGLWLKWLAIGAIAGGLGATGASQLFDTSSRPAPPAPARVLATPSSTPTPAPALLEPAPEEPVAPPNAAASGHPVTPLPNAGPQPSTGDTLGAELARIDGARRRQASGDPRGAIAELDAYQREFPRGRFASEAALVRAESLVALGDCAAALRLAPAGDGGLLSRRWKALHARCP